MADVWSTLACAALLAALYGIGMAAYVRVHLPAATRPGDLSAYARSVCSRWTRRQSPALPVSAPRPGADSVGVPPVPTPERRGTAVTPRVRVPVVAHAWGAPELPTTPGRQVAPVTPPGVGCSTGRGDAPHTSATPGRRVAPVEQSHTAHLGQDGGDVQRRARVPMPRRADDLTAGEGRQVADAAGGAAVHHATPYRTVEDASVPGTPTPHDSCSGRGGPQTALGAHLTTTNRCAPGAPTLGA